MDDKKMVNGIKLILEGIGEDVNRKGIAETPERVAEMYREIFAGYQSKAHLDTFTDEQIGDEIIVVKNIPFYSMCEHHLLPFFGKVDVAYLPLNNRITGFSALSQLVDVYARRLQIQERLTRQIATAMMDNLKPKGVFVQVEAKQLCVSMRGIKKEAVLTYTQAIEGNIPLERIKLAGLS
jgi:GTP cyclohydrolase I